MTLNKNLFDYSFKIIILINNLNSCVFQINVQMNLQYMRTYYLHGNLVKTREAIRYTGVLDRMTNGCRAFIMLK